VDPTYTGDVIDEADNCSTGINALYTDNTSNVGSISVVGYIVRTWTLTDNCGNSTSKTQTIWVQPVPKISVAVPDTVCNGSQIDFAIDSLVISRGTVMYDLNILYPAGITGTLSNGSNPIANISDNLVNSTDTYQTVTYTFSPYIQGKPGDPTCHNGIDTTIYVIVEPTAKVTGSIVNSEICNNGNATINLSTVTIASIGLQFNVSVINNYSEITGYSNLTGLVVTDIINQTLNNSGDAARLVRYVITPYIVGPGNIQKCQGISDTVEVWVNPTPRFVAVNSTPRICSGALTNIILNTPTITSASGTVMFDYTVAATVGNTVLIGDRTPVTDFEPGKKISFNYRNESDTIQSVYFIVTPKINGLPCANGVTDTVEVKVHAKPLQDLYISTPLLCSDGNNGALTVVTSKGAGDYFMKWEGPNSYLLTGTNLTTISNLRKGNYKVTVTDNLGCPAWKDTTLTSPSMAIYFSSSSKLPADMYNVSCHGANDATILLYLTGGTLAPYSYKIIRNSTDILYTGILAGTLIMTDPSTYLIQNNVSAGDYTVVITDFNGCIATQSIHVTEPKLIEAEFNTVNVLCNGYNTGSISSKVRGGIEPYYYQWSTTDGNIPGSVTGPSITNLIAGTYNLVVTDSMSCTSHFDVVVTQPDGIDLLSQNITDVSCNGGSDGSIELTFDGTYNYSWSRASLSTWHSSDEDPKNLPKDDYELVVTDSKGCQKTYYFTVNEPPLLILGVSKPILADGFNIACNGTTVPVDATVTGGTAPYTYMWTKPAVPSWSSTEEDPSALGAGTYHLVVKDSHNCSVETDVVLTEHSPIILSTSISKVTCHFNDGAIDLSVSGGVSPYNYTWTGPAGATLIAGQEDQSNLIVGDYSVTVTDSYNCSQVLNITMDPPAKLEVTKQLSDFNGFNISCYGRSDGSISVTPVAGVSPFTYSWSGPDGYTSTASSITGLKAGTYIMQITDAIYCSLADTTVLSSPGQADMEINPSESTDGSYNINCYGDATGTIDITPVNVVGTPVYSWSDGGGNVSNRTGLTSGTYIVIMSDQNGCSAKDTIKLTAPEKILISIADTILPFCQDSNDGEIHLSVAGGIFPYYYSWSNGVSGNNAGDMTGLAAGIYNLTLTDNNNCEARSAVSLGVKHEICLEIPNAFSPNDDGINDVWNIGKMDLYPEAEVFILNRWGELVWKSSRGYPEPWDGRSRGKRLPIDSYHYTIDLHNGRKPIVGHVTIVK